MLCAMFIFIRRVKYSCIPTLPTRSRVYLARSKNKRTSTCEDRTPTKSKLSTKRLDRH